MKITFVMEDRQSGMFEKKSQFEFRKDKGWLFLQKICFWFLDKIGAYAQEERIKWVQRDINTKSFMEKLLAYASYLEERFYFKPGMIIMGAKDYQLVMGDVEAAGGMFQFNSKYQWGERGQMTIMGLRVVVVPWIEGIIVMPKDFSDK